VGVFTQPGTITDVYADNDVQLKQMDGDKLVDIPADKKSEFVMRNYYVFSAAGILQKNLLDIPRIGVNGEIVHNIQDTASMQVTITGRHKAQP
jgi:hypothetical protein